MQRGELVVTIAGAQAVADDAAAARDRVLRVLLKSLPPSQAASLAAELTGTRRNECYERALEIVGAGPRQPA
jgi:16S rRNA (cytidine1402-2'-O)-methyltransferase